MSRSELFTVAVGTYLDREEASGLTAQINEALAAAGDDENSGAVTRRGRELLADESW